MSRSLKQDDEDLSMNCQPYVWLPLSPFKSKFNFTSRSQFCSMRRHPILFLHSALCSAVKNTQRQGIARESLSDTLLCQTKTRINSQDSCFLTSDCRSPFQFFYKAAQQQASSDRIDIYLEHLRQSLISHIGV